MCGAQLLLVQGLYFLQGARLLWVLVGPYSKDAGKPKGVAGVVAIATGDGVERDLQNNPGLHPPEPAQLTNRVLLEPLGELLDLRVGKPGVRLPDHAQPESVPYRKSIVAENPRALPVPKLDTHYHHVQGGKGFLPRAT